MPNPGNSECESVFPRKHDCADGRSQRLVYNHWTRSVRDAISSSIRTPSSQLSRNLAQVLTTRDVHVFAELTALARRGTLPRFPMRCWAERLLAVNYSRNETVPKRRSLSLTTRTTATTFPVRRSVLRLPRFLLLFRSSLFRWVARYEGGGNVGSLGSL